MLFRDYNGLFMFENDFYKKLFQNAMLFLIKYSLFIIAGVNLLSNNFELKPWILSMILMITSFIVTPKQRIL
ncbi:hypothetical protein AAIB48_00515 (plasmid) [Paraclostridium benzoelyticum]|uniref:hypothetical protein n=1 Tax=Paraclostridium benzoelyticum TaxID=1629550 RepID=UPI0031CD79F8